MKKLVVHQRAFNNATCANIGDGNFCCLSSSRYTAGDDNSPFPRMICRGNTCCRNPSNTHIPGGCDNNSDHHNIFGQKARDQNG